MLYDGIEEEGLLRCVQSFGQERKYFGGSDCHCVQLTCEVSTPSTSVDGMQDRGKFGNGFLVIFWSNLITYWFNFTEQLCVK